MAKNVYGQTYSGNDDFRGWLAGGSASSLYGGMPTPKLMYGGRPEDATALTKTLLGQLGNNGRSGNAYWDKAGQYLYDQWNKGRTGEDPAITAAKLSYQATMAQIAAQPKLIYRDTNAAWQQAQNTAAKSINPVYQDYLNQFIERQKNALSQNTANIGANKTASDVALGQTQEDILTNKERTNQDTTSAINQNLYNEANWQTQEGRDAAAVEDQARLAMGDTGTMGRGAGQLQDAKLARNLASDIQTKTFKDERDVKKLLETRTFADLDTKGTRAVQLNAVEKADLDRQLSDFIVNQGTAKTQFTSENETARLGALYGATNAQYKTDTAAWLSSLNGNQRAQDIALATQIYGAR